jgi:hypothetical protein
VNGEKNAMLLPDVDFPLPKTDSSNCNNLRFFII